MGRHENHFTAGQVMRLAGNMNFHLAFDHLHQRIERRGVLAQALALVRGKERHTAGGPPDNLPARKDYIFRIKASSMSAIISGE